jgi:hypothetical protein
LASTVRPWLQLDVFGQFRPATGTKAGPVRGTKIIVADHDLPGLDELVLLINRGRPGPVALHAVTYEALVLAMCALEAAGRDGDRIEHAFLASEGYPQSYSSGTTGRGLPRIGAHPGFLWSQGNRLAKVLRASEQHDYQRLHSWHRAGYTPRRNGYAVWNTSVVAGHAVCR